MAVVVGDLLGLRSAEHADWHTGTVTVGGQADRPLASATLDGTSYGFRTIVPTWTARGVTQTNSWPSCLARGSTAGPRRVHVRFATVDVAAAGRRWKQVVAVECAR